MYDCRADNFGITAPSEISRNPQPSPSHDHLASNSRFGKHVRAKSGIPHLCLWPFFYPVLFLYETLQRVPAGRKWLSDVLAHAQETLQKKHHVQVSAAESRPVLHASGTDSDAISVQAHTGNFHSEDAQSTTIDHIGRVVETNSHVAVPSFPLQLLLHGNANSGPYSGCSK